MSSKSRCCPACEKWIQLYEEEKARRIELEMDLEMWKEMYYKQRKSYNDRIRNLCRVSDFNRNLIENSTENYE